MCGGRRRRLSRQVDWYEALDPDPSRTSEGTDVAKRDGGTILQTAFSAPFTGNGFGNFKAAKIDQAKPADRMPAGLGMAEKNLRKSTAVEEGWWSRGESNP